MESGIITINANANTATLGSITTIVLCSVIIIAIIIIAIEIAFSIETIVTIELIMVSITVITLELGIMSVFANEAFRVIEMSIICRGCRGIRSAQWQGELDGPDVTGRDVSVGSEFAGIWVFPRKGLVFLRMRHFHVKCGIFVDGLVACVA
jgi:hypothetical protein